MEENKLFARGIKAYNKYSFYDAHEYWEEIWTDKIILDDTDEQPTEKVKDLTSDDPVKNDDMPV